MGTNKRKEILKSELTKWEWNDLLGVRDSGVCNMNDINCINGSANGEYDIECLREWQENFLYYNEKYGNESN